MGGPLVIVGLELLLGDDGGDTLTLTGGSSSFLIKEVMSKPLKGFCSVLVGDISLSSLSWLGLRAGLGRSVMISQSVISVDQAGPGHETKI